MPWPCGPSRTGRSRSWPGTAVPVINALSNSPPLPGDGRHADDRGALARLEGVKLVFVGDGNNVARSLAVACAKSGVASCWPAPRATTARTSSGAWAEVPEVLPDDRARPGRRSPGPTSSTPTPGPAWAGRGGHERRGTSPRTRSTRHCWMRPGRGGRPALPAGPAWPGGHRGRARRPRAGSSPRRPTGCTSRRDCSPGSFRTCPPPSTATVKPRGPIRIRATERFFSDRHGLWGAWVPHPMERGRLARLGEPDAGETPAPGRIVWISLQVSHLPGAPHNP